MYNACVWCGRKLLKVRKRKNCERQEWNINRKRKNLSKVRKMAVFMVLLKIFWIVTYCRILHVYW